MTIMYRVRRRRTLSDKRGKVIGRPGDLFPADDPNCKANPSAVRLVEVSDEAPTPEAKIVEDEEPDPFDYTHADDPGDEE